MLNIMTEDYLEVDKPIPGQNYVGKKRRDDLHKTRIFRPI